MEGIIYRNLYDEDGAIISWLFLQTQIATVAGGNNHREIKKEG